jgi:transcriptional regulator GlxA family with amidase domain
VHKRGAVLGSACSGAVLLGEAGLLTDREATIHWGYVATLTRNYKGVRVKPDQSLVLSGEAQRVLMAGGGSSWQDLALYLIARYVGLQEAIEVARVYMLQWHDMGQQPFAQLMGLRQTDDAMINNCQQWIAVNYRDLSPIAALTEMSGLAGRTFLRRFKAATGLTPMDYVHAVRLEEAKQMLETSELPVEAIAGEVGYQDTSFFTRLFRRRVGLTPAQYRRRFGALKRALSGAK